MARWKFTTPLIYKGKSILEGFKILKLDNLTHESVRIYFSTGYFQEDTVGNEVDFQPLISDLLDIDGVTYTAIKNKMGDSTITLETLLVSEAYKAIVAWKGPTWAGSLHLT